MGRRRQSDSKGGWIEGASAQANLVICPLLGRPLLGRPLLLCPLLGHPLLGRPLLGCPLLFFALLGHALLLCQQLLCSQLQRCLLIGRLLGRVPLPNRQRVKDDTVPAQVTRVCTGRTKEGVCNVRRRRSAGRCAQWTLLSQPT